MFFWAYSGIGTVGISQTIVPSLASLIPESGCKTFIVTLFTLMVKAVQLLMITHER